MSFFTDFCEFYKLPQEATKFGLSLLFSFPIGFIVKKIIVKTTSHDDDISNYHDSGSSSNHHHHDNTSSSNPTSHHDHRSGSNLSNATKTTPHLINFILTSLLTIFLFSPISYLLLLLSALTTYTLSWLGISPSINFMIIFIQLLAVQVKMQVYGGMTDFSSIMMVMTIKLTAFAYAYNDRKYINEDSDEDTTKGTSTETTTKSNTKKLDEYQQKHVIKELPPLITYLGYCFNIVGYFVGPGLEFKDYQAWVTSGFGVRVKGLGLRSLKVFVLGVGLMVLHLGLEGRYHFSHVTEPWFALLTPFQKYIYITISGVIVRSKFHAAWKVSEAVGLISGLGVRNVDGVVRFDGCENVDIVGVEFGENPKMMMDSWNKFTASWLRRYIYTRVSIPSLKLPLTFIVSAVWHGVYIGYYTTFISSVLLTESARAIRKSIRPLFQTHKYYALIYDIFGRLVSMSMMNYLVVSFILRDLDQVWKGWYSLGFYGHVGMITSLVILKGGGERLLKDYGQGRRKSE